MPTRITRGNGGRDDGPDAPAPDRQPGQIQGGGQLALRQRFRAWASNAAVTAASPR
jgi:hypothetical protein